MFLRFESSVPSLWELIWNMFTLSTPRLRYTTRSRQASRQAGTQGDVRAGGWGGHHHISKQTFFFSWISLQCQVLCLVYTRLECITIFLLVLFTSFFHDFMLGLGGHLLWIILKLRIRPNCLSVCHCLHAFMFLTVYLLVWLPSLPPSLLWVTDWNSEGPECHDGECD